jgi:hypothetical protein
VNRPFASADCPLPAALARLSGAKEEEFEILSFADGAVESFITV